MWHVHDLSSRLAISRHETDTGQSYTQMTGTLGPEVTGLGLLLTGLVTSVNLAFAGFYLFLHSLQLSSVE